MLAAYIIPSLFAGAKRTFLSFCRGKVAAHCLQLLFDRNTSGFGAFVVLRLHIRGRALQEGAIDVIP